MARLFRFSRTLMLGLAAFALPALAQAAAPAGDPAAGQALFKSRCAICHYVVEDGAPHPGPLLKGVVGRKAGTTAFKGYSPALKASGKVWSLATLDQFLALPSKVVPGTFMVINLPKDSERHDVVAYLATLK
ncbi:MAG TPA: c-type cytochrome [Caulobacteraceae bacterium]|jgi:cytochrome c|nr:c-type cytochrome [Caulobacteraceae bacterium]